MLLDLHAASWVDADRYEIRPDARRFENWETNFAGKIGLGVAADYALGWGLPAIQLRVLELADALRAALAEIPGCTVRDLGKTRCGIVTFTLDGHDTARLKAALARQHINITYTTLAGTRLDMAARGLTSMIRASVHYYNTTDEIDRFCAALRALAAAS